MMWHWWQALGTSTDILAGIPDLIGKSPLDQSARSHRDTRWVRRLGEIPAAQDAPGRPCVPSALRTGAGSAVCEQPDTCTPLRRLFAVASSCCKRASATRVSIRIESDRSVGERGGWRIMAISQGIYGAKTFARYWTQKERLYSNVVQVWFLECAFQASKTNALSVFRKLESNSDDTEGY